MISELKIAPNITPRDSESLKRYLVEVNTTYPLTPDQEVELALRIQRGDLQARNELVQANLRFVISIAKQYQNTGVPLEDLINEGNIGLIRAAERFDSTRGFKFDTFAVWWIRQAITSSLADVSRMVRLPVNLVGQLIRMRKVEATLEQLYERQPTADEIGERMNMPVERVMELMNHTSRTTSLDAPLTEDSESTLMDVLVSAHEDATDATLISESLAHDLNQALASLPQREGYILRTSFGLDGAAESLEMIAQDLHITRERVRQLREKAVRTLHDRYGVILNKYIS